MTQAVTLTDNDPAVTVTDDQAVVASSPTVSQRVAVEAAAVAVVQ